MKKIIFVVMLAIGVMAALFAVPATADVLTNANIVPLFDLNDLTALSLVGFGMVTLASDQPRDYFEGDFHDFPMIASDIIYQGAAVGDNGSGYARPLVAGDPFRGFAQLKVDNSSGAAGAKYVRCRTRGDVQLAISALAITDVGKDVYASDDGTFTLTAGSNTRIGHVHAWVSTGVGIIRFAATTGVMTELTDGTGGTANTTLTALGGITTLTDSSGYDGTHDDTIAAMAAITTLTDSTGQSGTHDDTLAATTVPSALTENGAAIGGTSDGDLPALVAPAGDAGASLIAGVRENATMINTIITLLGVMAQNQSDTAQKVIELVAREAVAAQNISDVSQKIIELVADIDDAKNNFADLTAAVNTIIRRLGN